MLRMLANAWADAMRIPISMFPTAPPQEDTKERSTTDTPIEHKLTIQNYQATGRNCIYPPHPKSGHVHTPFLDNRLIGESDDEPK